jgi:hypothetical protein
MLPLAKSEGLIIEEVSGETLVYDRSSKKAHCLNPTAALVWRSCDGKTSLAEMAARLRVELDAPADEKLVRLSLARLAEANLLEEQPGETHAPFSRRELAGRLGLVGALSLILPVVTTINAPAAAQAASGPQQGCVPLGGGCTPGGAPCCPGEGQTACINGVCQPVFA